MTEAYCFQIEKTKQTELLKCELDIMTKKHQNNDTEVNHLISQLDKLRQLNQDLKIKNSDLETEKQRLDRKCVSLDEQVSHLTKVQAENDELNQEVRVKRKEISDVRKEFRSVEGDLQELDIVKKDLSVKTTQVSQLTHDLSLVSI